ncbi:MAG: hypothetical protein WAM97_05205 [Acidimicrobiales bacterium]
MRRGRVVSWLSLLVLVVFSVIAATASAYIKPTVSTFGITGSGSLVASPSGFAGYNYVGSVQQVSADLIVPSITSIPHNAPYATASTWIGAQNAQGSFIQIGVTEYEQRPQFQDELGQPYYNGFWSDTQKDFHPDPLFQVQPGDFISLRMILEPTGWKLVIDDITTGRVQSISSDYGASDIYDFAEWIQEDPVSSADPFQNLPYPATTTVSFSHLKVDQLVPQMGSDNRQAMYVEDGPLLLPTRFSGDSFDVIPATGFARQYLSDVAVYDYSLTIYTAAVNQQHGRSGMAKVVSDAQLFAGALGQFSSAIHRQHWPTRVESDLQPLLSANQQLESDVEQVASDGGTTDAELQVLHDEVLGQEYSEQVRTDLGLPPPS